MQLRAERREESWMSEGPTATDVPSINEVLFRSCRFFLA
jgi:hypothetical protein